MGAQDSAAGSGILTVDRATLERLAGLLLDRAGLKISSEGYHSLRLALSARLPVLNTEDPAEYVQWLHEPSGEQELRALIPLVTVGYTEFFRDARQFRALELKILPDMIAAARRDRRTAQIWSAGCATGEEAYSLAIALHELGATPNEVSVLATDLNLAAVENARAGLYPSRRLSGVGPTRLTHYFQAGPTGGFEVQAFLRPYIRFDGHNLAAPLQGRITTESLDLILCRNVIIYFDLPTIRALMERFLTALRPGGFLLLGYSESLFKVYDKFEMVEVEGAFIYRRPLDPGPRKPVLPLQERKFTPTSFPVVKLPIAPPRSTPPPTPVAVTPPSSPAPIAGQAATQVDIPITPLRARERVLTPLAVPAAGALGAAVTAPGASGAAAIGVAVPRASGIAATAGRSPLDRLDAAVHQMELGDFLGARSALESLTEDEPNDLDALLTLGNLYSLLGEHAHARDAFQLALKREPLCVDARVFLGVAALQAGVLPEARAELSRALFLEPTLALGHYLLAQVHERSKHAEDARRAYRNAISQLKYAQRPLAGHYPDTPDSTESISRAARYALAALEEEGGDR